MDWKPRRECFRALLEGGKCMNPASVFDSITPPKDLRGIARSEVMNRVTRDAGYKRWTKDFLGG